MSVLLVLVLGSLMLSAAASLLLLFAWRRADPSSRALVQRLARLPLRSKFSLAAAVARDRRIPIAVRAVPPLLVLYLALPIDIVPDFIPVLGQLDDVLLAAAGLGVLLRFTPRAVLEEQIERLSAPRAAGS